MKKTSTRGKVVSAALLLMALQALEQLIALAKQVLIGAQFGTTAVMDAFIVALTIVGLIQLWFVLPIRQTLIPIFRTDRVRQGESVAWANAGTLLNNLLLFVLATVTLGLIAAPVLVRTVAPGLEAETTALATQLARVVMVTALFFVLSNFISHIYFSYERFLVPGVVGAVNHVVTIAAFFALGSMGGIYGLAGATVLGSLAELTGQLPILWKKRQLYPRKIDLRHPALREMGKLSAPLLLSSSSREASVVTDRIFASRLPAGSLTALAFSHRLIAVAVEAFIRPVQKSVFPHFAKLSAKRDLSRLSVNLFEFIRVLFFLTLPIALGIMVLAESIVTAVYKRGAFDERSVRLTSQALALYAIGIPALTVGRVLNNVFFALKNTRTPSGISVARVIVKLVLAWLFIPRLGHAAIALAEAVSQSVGAGLLFVFLPAELKGRNIGPTIASLGRSLAASLGMASIVYCVGDTVAGVFVPAVEVGLLVAVGVGAYALLGFFFGGTARESLSKSLAPLKAKYLNQHS